MLLLLGTAGATPDGYRVTGEANDCTLMLGPDEGGVVPMRAECHWPDVSPERLDTLLVQWGRHDDYFSNVAEASVLRQEGETSIVHQRHVSRGISDREVVIAQKKSSVEGGYRYEWTLAEEDHEPSSGNVLAARNDGYWEVRPHDEGGSQVVYQLAYDPGGRVPGFLVRWFQTSGLTEIVTDMRTAATD